MPYPFPLRAFVNKGVILTFTPAEDLSWVVDLLVHRFSRDAQSTRRCCRMEVGRAEEMPALAKSAFRPG